MRSIVFFVICLIFNYAQASNVNPTLPGSSPHFNCEELSSHVQALKESSRSKKEKFACILNLLKGALSDELENSQCQSEVNDLMSYKKDLEEKLIAANNLVASENDKKLEHDAQSKDKALFEKLVSKVTQSKTKEYNNTQNLEVPLMIPIFKPRQSVKNELNPNFSDNINPVRQVMGNSRAVPTEAIQANQNPTHNAPKFTIPCQRAIDILDMNVGIPKEICENKNVYANFKPIAQDSGSVVANQTPSNVAVHCTDCDESVAMLFKPKAVSLMQLYGNLLKKITITVLVPYHMSKLGQQ